MNRGPAVPPQTATKGQPNRGPAAPGSPDAPGAPLQVDSQSLLQGRATLIIAHHGELYRLQRTRQGKLILTK